MTIEEQKAHALAKLRGSREINSFKDTPYWRDAFALYNANKKGRALRMNCGVCFKTVKEWLER